MMSPHHHQDKSLRQRIAELATAASIAAAALLSTGLPSTSPALAGDLDLSTSGTETDDGRFVRIGLNKSVVIRLPTDAKDVIVGNPGIVDAVVRNKRTAYLFARGVGQTNIFFFDGSGQQIMNIDLEVALDMKALQKLIDRTIPGSQITVDTVNNNVVLGGTAASAAEARIAEDLALKFANQECSCQIVNTINVTGGDQVMLKVRVVEMQRSILKNLGVNARAALNIGDFAFDLATANPAANAAGQIIGSFTGSDFSSEVMIEAMERDGILRTLAEPTLTAISGQSAAFHAGGELPYQTCSLDQGVRTCTVTFRSVGVSLNFTPTVLSEGRIGLKVRTEVSERGSDTILSYPTIDSRTADTTIELPSGGSMMLAGLIKNVTQTTIEGTPGLKDLPVLGALFRSRDFQQNQTEMVVLVTPYIVNPVHQSALVSPDKNLSLASDRQGLMWGRINKVYGTPGKNPDGVYHGNVGFIVE